MAFFDRYLPFQGEGFTQNWKRTYDTITWIEFRPIYRKTRKGDLRLLGGVKYYVDKFAEDAEEGIWHRAHYHFRGLMTPSGYRKALKEEQEDRTKDGLTKRLAELDKASRKERKAREKALILLRALRHGAGCFALIGLKLRQN